MLLNSNKKYFWIFISVVFVIIFIILCVFFIKIIKQKKEIKNNLNTVDKIKNEKDNKLATKGKRRLIDGVFVSEEYFDNQPFAIMINNHIDARPTLALSKANLVIEAEVEGGITRYMAVFADHNKIDEIGSVRSARPYFVDWAQEIDAIFVHCGGSPEALVKIAKDGVKDMNEFYNGDFFWRDSDRAAPHNIFTSTEKINSFLEKKNFKKGDYFSWEYKDDLDIEKRPVNSNIKIEYILKGFDVVWKYDKENNEYIRYLGGNVHADKDGEIISAKNIVIQYISAKEIDDELRLKMDVLGEGKADFCVDGSCVDAIWKKNNSKARTRFYNNIENEEELKFNAGTTWIEVVRPEREVILSE